MTVNSIGSSYLEEKSGNTHKNTKRLTGDFRTSLAGSIEKKEENGREEQKVNGRVVDIKNFYDAAAAGCVSETRLHGRFPNANRKIYLPETATGLR